MSTEDAGFSEPDGDITAALGAALAEPLNAPWTPERLAGVMTAAVYEHFTSALGTSFTFSAHGQDETYELLDPESDGDEDVLTFERTSDGARFDVEFWADVTRKAKP